LKSSIVGRAIIATRTTCRGGDPSAGGEENRKARFRSCKERSELREFWGRQTIRHLPSEALKSEKKIIRNGTLHHDRGVIKKSVDTLPSPSLLHREAGPLRIEQKTTGK